MAQISIFSARMDVEPRATSLRLIGDYYLVTLGEGTSRAYNTMGCESGGTILLLA